jgi:hypothetical protein
LRVKMLSVGEIIPDIQRHPNIDFLSHCVQSVYAASGLDRTDAA